MGKYQRKRAFIHFRQPLQMMTKDLYLKYESFVQQEAWSKQIIIKTHYIEKAGKYERA